MLYVLTRQLSTHKHPRHHPNAIVTVLTVVTFFTVVTLFTLVTLFTRVTLVNLIIQARGPTYQSKLGLVMYHSHH